MNAVTAQARTRPKLIEVERPCGPLDEQRVQELGGVLGAEYRIEARPSSPNEDFAGGVKQRPEE